MKWLLLRYLFPIPARSKNTSNTTATAAIVSLPLSTNEPFFPVASVFGVLNAHTSNPKTHDINMSERMASLVISV